MIAFTGSGPAQVSREWKRKACAGSKGMDSKWTGRAQYYCKAAALLTFAWCEAHLPRHRFFRAIDKIMHMRRHACWGDACICLKQADYRARTADHLLQLDADALAADLAHQCFPYLQHRSTAQLVPPHRRRVGKGQGSVRISVRTGSGLGSGSGLDLTARVISRVGVFAQGSQCMRGMAYPRSNRGKGERSISVCSCASSCSCASNIVQSQVNVFTVSVRV